MEKPDIQRATIGFQALFKNYAFLTLWAGQIISQVADKVFFILLTILAVNNYQPPALLETFELQNSMKAIVIFANTLPAVFLGSAAGLFIDRLSKKQILWTTNLMRGILVLLIPVFAKTNFFLLLLIAALESILTQFFAPAEQAAIPVLVKKDNLMSANALFTTTMMGSIIVGFAIGEPILGLAFNRGGEIGRELLVGGLYITASLILAIVPMREKAIENTVQIEPWQDFKQGLLYLKQNKKLADATLQLSILYSTFAALIILSGGLAKDIGLKETQFGFFVAAVGVGLILGAGFLGQWGHHVKHLPLSLLGFVSMGIMLIGFGLSHQIWIALVLSVLLGIGAASIGVPMQTFIQLETPSEMRGKIFGLQNNLINIALSVPLVITALLADLFGTRVVLIGLGSVMGLLGLWIWQKMPHISQESL
jgi:MFS family permease